MKARLISSREFNQNTSGAKKAANEGPVFITDRGKPAHVLLTYSDYLELARGKQSIKELMASDDTLDLEFPRIDEVPRPANLT